MANVRPKRRPLADALVADYDAAQAQAEAVIQPNRVLDDLGRLAKATVGVRAFIHSRLPRPTTDANLTTPSPGVPIFLELDRAAG